MAGLAAAIIKRHGRLKLPLLESQHFPRNLTYIVLSTQQGAAPTGTCPTCDERPTSRIMKHINSMCRFGPTS